MELDAEYQFVVNPGAFPSIDISCKQQHVHDEQDLSPEERHNLLELLVGYDVEVGVQDE